MMTTNRRIGIFETNSSSSHSITLCVSPSKCMDQIPLTEEGVACIYPGEFGWGPSDHNDAPTKASYCLVHAMNSISGIFSAKTPNNQRPLSPEYATEQELAHPLVQMLERVIKRGTGCAQVQFIPSSDDYYRWGYIDHESTNVPVSVFDNDDVMFGFIFNPRSELHIDHDNH